MLTHHQFALANFFVNTYAMSRYGSLAPRDAMRKRGLCVYPSVRLSVTLVDYISMAEDIITFLSRPGSPSFCFIDSPAPLPNSQGNPVYGAQNTRGWEKIAIFD